MLLVPVFVHALVAVHIRMHARESILERRKALSVGTHTLYARDGVIDKVVGTYPTCVGEDSPTMGLPLVHGEAHV